MARKYAIQQRLVHERINIVRNGYSRWNDQEKQFLMTVKNDHNWYSSIGSLLRVDYQYSINELTEDPDNIVFKRSAKS